MTPDDIRYDSLTRLAEDMARRLSDNGQHDVATRMLGSGPSSAIPVADALCVAVGLASFLIRLGDNHREWLEGRLCLAAGELASVHPASRPVATRAGKCRHAALGGGRSRGVRRGR